MAVYNKGSFNPKNKSKYVGLVPITYRSTWELTFMNLCDTHPNIIQWASESIKIPYQSPLDGRWHIYIPDFLVIYLDNKGMKHAEMVEIKPIKQSPGEFVENYNPRPGQIPKSKKDILAYKVNEAKWAAARLWCLKNRFVFRVLTEEQLFKNASR